jgi:hypothetical protein
MPQVAGIHVHPLLSVVSDSVCRFLDCALNGPKHFGARILELCR